MKYLRRLWMWICSYESMDVSIVKGTGAGQSRRCWARKYGKWQNEPTDMILESPWDIQPDSESVFKSKHNLGIVRSMKIFEFLRKEPK